MADSEPFLVDLSEEQDSPVPEDLDAVLHAATMLACPWNRRAGICSSGCQDEPMCQTNAPDGGWARALVEAALEMVVLEEAGYRSGEK